MLKKEDLIKRRIVILEGIKNYDEIRVQLYCREEFPYPFCYPVIDFVKYYDKLMEKHSTDLPYLGWTILREHLEDILPKLSNMGKKEVDEMLENIKKYLNQDTRTIIYRIQHFSNVFNGSLSIIVGKGQVEVILNSGIYYHRFSINPNNPLDMKEEHGVKENGRIKWMNISELSRKKISSLYPIYVVVLRWNSKKEEWGNVRIQLTTTLNRTSLDYPLEELIVPEEERNIKELYADLPIADIGYPLYSEL